MKEVLYMYDDHSVRTCVCSAPSRTAGAAAPAATAAADNGDTDTGDACTCCKQSMREALKLLCSSCISDVVDFDAFAFLTDSTVVGTTPSDLEEGDDDNLGTLTGTFRRFSPCSCDLIDIAGTAVTPFGSTVAVTQNSLCALSAIAFGLLPVEGGDDDRPAGCCPETTLSRYRRVRDLIQAQLADTDSCGACTAHCDCSDDCCCTEGVLAALSNASMNQRATLTAGLLAVRDATVLGTVGSVLVLGNEAESRFYFVCADRVEFLA